MSFPQNFVLPFLSPAFLAFACECDTHTFRTTAIRPELLECIAAHVFLVNVKDSPAFLAHEVLVAAAVCVEVVLLVDFKSLNPALVSEEV